jgi:lipid A 3-O-deacylase
MGKYQHFPLALLICLMLYLPDFTYAAGLDALSISRGDAYGELDIYKAGLRKNFKRRWFTPAPGSVNGYWEMSLGYWEYKNESITTYAISPVFVYEFNLPYSNLKPYLDIGIGAAYISGTKIQRRNMSSHLHFEDQHDINVRFLHYSNFGFAEPNDGIDITLFSYTYWFESR